MQIPVREPRLLKLAYLRGAILLSIVTLVAFLVAVELNAAEPFFVVIATLGLGGALSLTLLGDRASSR